MSPLAAEAFFNCRSARRTLVCPLMQDETENPYRPPESKNSDPVPFPTRRFWFAGLLPVVPSIACAFVQSNELALFTLLSVIPCSLAAGIIYALNRRTGGIAAAGIFLLIVLGFIILDTTAAFVGCSAGNTFQH